MNFFSANKFTITGLTICIAASTIIAVTSYKQTKKAKDTSTEIVHTNLLLASLDKMVITGLQAQTDLRNFIITGDKKYTASLYGISKTFKDNIAFIRTKEAKDESYTSKLDSLEATVYKYVLTTKKLTESTIFQNKAENATLLLLNESDQLSEVLKRLCENIKINELLRQQYVRLKNEKAIQGLNKFLNVALLVAVILAILLLIKVRKSFIEHRNGEEKFKALLESAPDAMVITDDKGIIQLANREAERMFASPRTDLLATAIEKLIVPKPDNRSGGLKETYLQVLQKGSMLSNIEKEAVQPDGFNVPVEISLSPIRINKETYIAVAVRDISQRKATQQQIQNLFAQINQTNEAIYILDTNFIIQSWNKGAENIYGYSKEEAIGTESVQLLKPNMTPEEISKTDEQVQKSGLWAGEIDRITKAGSKISVYSSLTAIKNESGNISSYVSVSFDISYRKKLESQVNYLASIVEQSTEAVISVNNERKIISWNNGAEKLHGYTAAEAIGKTILELGIANYTDEDLKVIFTNLLQHGKWVREDILHHKNSNSFWGLITANPIKDPTGNIQSVVFFEKDISLQRQLKDELKHHNLMLEQKVKERTEQIALSEQKYKLLYDSNPIPMWVFEIETLKILDVNKSLELLYGYSRQEFLKMTLLDIRSDEEKEKFLQVDHSFDKKEVGLNRGIWKHLKKDGTELHVEIFNHPVVYEGKKARITMLIDITERLKAQTELAASEKRFRALIENSYDIITMLDRDFKVLYRSPSAIRVTGRTDDEVIGLDGRERIHPDDIKIVAPGIKRLLSEPGRTEECIFRYKHKDGSYLWMEGNATNLLHDENIKAIVYNYRDVTERVKYDEALKEEKMKLERISAASPGLIYSFRMTPDGKFSFPYVSSAHEEIFGLPVEVMTNNVNEIIETAIKEDADIIIKSIIESAQNMTPWKQEFRYKHPVKGIKWLQGNSIPAKEADGSIIWHGIIMDITEKIKTAKALEEEKDKLVKIANISPGLLYSFRMNFDKEFSFPFVSNAVDDIFGISGEKVMANSGVIFEKIYDADVNLLIASIFDSAEKMTQWEYTFRYNHPQKGSVWLRGISLPIKEPDDSILWHGIVMDITEQKKVEETIKNSLLEKQLLADRVTTILNTLPANIALLDEQGIIVDVNQAWKNFADSNGLIGSNYGIGENYIQISEKSLNFINTDRPKIAEGIANVLSKKIQEFVHEYECNCPGDERWFRMIVSPLSGSIYSGAVVMHINISEIKKLEAERLWIKSEEQKLVTTAILQGQEKERNSIGKELHDNINQILAGINMLLVLISKRPERLNDLLPVCIQNVALAITENRKIAHELVTPDAETENIIEQIKRITQNILENAGIVSIIDDNGFNENVLSKEQSLAVYRIIQEQYTNILKYAHAKEVQLKLTTTKQYFNMEISDDGKGADVTKISGGIGLQNIKSRVNVFNGVVKLNSSAGNGFALTVQIPLEPLK